MTQSERGRTYCAAIGADPDEKVWGPPGTGKVHRWQLYRNACLTVIVNDSRGVPCTVLHDPADVAEPVLLGDAAVSALMKAPINLRNVAHLFPPNHG